MTFLENYNVIKLPSYKYLLKKCNYSIRSKIQNTSQSSLPMGIQQNVISKKVYAYELYDQKNKLVDTLHLEYLATPTKLENIIKSFI